MPVDRAANLAEVALRWSQSLFISAFLYIAV
jgi:hypothetical protein